MGSPLSDTMLLLLPLLLTSQVLAADPTVDITVYYEALCDDSQNFINTQLFPAYEHFGSDLNIALKPFGKAQWTEHGDSWQFTCQHGPNECYGNKVQACLLDQFPSASDHVPLVNCLMRTHTTPRPSLEACMQEIGCDCIPDFVLECAAGDEAATSSMILEWRRMVSILPSHLCPGFSSTESSLRRTGTIPWTTFTQCSAPSTSVDPANVDCFGVLGHSDTINVTIG